MSLAFWRRRDVPPPIVFPHEVIHPGGDDRYLNRAQLEQASYWLAHIAGAALEEVHEAFQREEVITEMGLAAANALDAELVDLRKDRDEIKAERDELLGALDERRPVPDRYQLGLFLEQNWHRWATQERTSNEAWACVADHALDYIRGLWPPASAAPPLPAGVELVDTDANRRLAETVVELLGLKPSSGGGEGAATGVSTAVATGDPAPDDPIAREAEADRVRDELGGLIAARDIELTGGSWAAMHPTLRDAYLDSADTIINAGWRPPLREVAG